MITTFFRLLRTENKETTLRSAVDAGSRGEVAADVFQVDPASLRRVPGSPFAYWVSDHIRGLFAQMPRCESDGRQVRIGGGPGDDFLVPALVLGNPR